MREVGLKRSRSRAVFVQTQQVVQVSCSAAPVSNYEKRILPNFGVPDLPTVEELLAQSVYMIKDSEHYQMSQTTETPAIHLELVATENFEQSAQSHTLNYLRPNAQVTP